MGAVYVIIKVSCLGYNNSETGYCYLSPCPDGSKIKVKYSDGNKIKIIIFGR